MPYRSGKGCGVTSSAVFGIVRVDKELDMSDVIDRIRDEVKKLTPDERADLIDVLIADMPQSDDAWDRAWAKVAAERAEELKSGRVKALTWDEVLAKRGRTA
jgi:putative addiction module component (TIGR02574 family)